MLLLKDTFSAAIECRSDPVLSRKNKPQLSPSAPARRVTIADVAASAGVSTMTVSRVLNDDDKVKEATKIKVEQAIAELKYAPNIAARTLAGSTIRRIGLLYGNPSSAYLGELLLGALQAASEAGAQLIVERTDSSFDPNSLEQHFRQDWDALIVPPPMSDLKGIREIVTQHNFPTVFLSSACVPGPSQEIRIDDQQAAYDMTEFLLQLGHRKIGFIKGNPNQTVSESRYVGYCQALTAGDIAYRDDYVAQGYFSYRSGESAAQLLLALPDAPTAIFASNDDMAAGVLAAAGRAGITVPDDLTVVGFDDSPIASTVWPSLTTIKQPVAEMAALAVELALKRRSNDPNDDREPIVLDHQIVQRASTTPCT